MERIEFTLSWSGDTFKHSWRGLRKKLLHYVGVAQIKFVPVENEEGYTELFEGGADHGFIRLSLAKKHNNHSNQIQLNHLRKKLN